MQKLGIICRRRRTRTAQFASIADAKTINVGVGHQSMCTDTTPQDYR